MINSAFAIPTNYTILFIIGAEGMSNFHLNFICENLEK